MDQRQYHESLVWLNPAPTPIVNIVVPVDFISSAYSYRVATTLFDSPSVSKIITFGASILPDPRILFAVDKPLGIFVLLPICIIELIAELIVAAELVS